MGETLSNLLSLLKKKSLSGMSPRRNSCLSTDLLLSSQLPNRSTSDATRTRNGVIFLTDSPTSRLETERRASPNAKLQDTNSPVSNGTTSAFAATNLESTERATSAIASVDPGTSDTGTSASTTCLVLITSPLPRPLLPQPRKHQRQPRKHQRQPRKLLPLKHLPPPQPHWLTHARERRTLITPAAITTQVD